MKHSQPFVTVKYASTLDGRIATRTGDSQWISCQETLTLAHQLRAEHDAIMVGVGTVLADNPRLNVRLVKGRDPLRVIVDGDLKIPLEANILSEDAAPGTLIATSPGADETRKAAIKELGAEVLTIGGEIPDVISSRVNLKQLLAELRRRQIQSVLVEGGAGIITALLREQLVNRLIVVIAPKIIGRGIEAIGDLSITRLRDAITFQSVKIAQLGTDVVFDCALE
ncbi:MAG: dihydrofolate reductase family protein [Acidobacteriota bacterium]